MQYHWWPQGNWLGMDSPNALLWSVHFALLESWQPLLGVSRGEDDFLAGVHSSRTSGGDPGKWNREQTTILLPKSGLFITLVTGVDFVRPVCDLSCVSRIKSHS